MALKVFKPITPGTRGRVDLRRDDLTADKPEKKLTSGKASQADAALADAFQCATRAAVTSRSTA